MTTLFQFNTSAIDVISGSGVMGLLDAAYAEIEREVREQLESRSPTGVDYDVSWQDGQLVIGLDSVQAEREFGSPHAPLNPTARLALLSAAESLRSRLVIRV